jgi:SAM-dependent methyltransferase
VTPPNPEQCSGPGDPWADIRYRGPDHPVVQIFAEEKLAVLGRQFAGERPDLADLETRAASKALELGAGPGIFTGALSGRFGSLVALDLSPTLLARNRHRRRVRADAMRIPFPDGTFDCVFAANLLHHIEDPLVCLQEAARVLRSSDGILLSIEPNVFHPLMFLFGLITPHERGLLSFTPGHMKRLARQAGFELKRRVITGQIFQNTTPDWLLPLLKPFERLNYPFGGYQLSLFRKVGG